MLIHLFAGIEQFYAWQKNTFTAHGAKGVHIGPHATLYTDMLLEDMRVRTSHVTFATLSPIALAEEWFRPMYPQIYASLTEDRRKRDLDSALKNVPKGEGQNERLPHVTALLSVFKVGAFIYLSWLAFTNFLLCKIK